MLCLQCSRWSYKKSLCNICWERLRSTKQLFIREVDSFPIYTMWTWPMNHQLKALWLQRLKGQEDVSPWKSIVGLVQELRSPQELPWGASTLWIPLPSSGVRNHALGLAKGLMQVYGGTLWDGLEITVLDHSRVEQKSKNRIERQNRVIKSRGRPPCTSFKTVCLVDDIITTGSTFRGAFTAIGHPENGLGIALMDRPLLK